MYIEHLLRVVQLILTLRLQLSIQPGTGAKVGDPTAGRDPGAGEDDDLLCIAEEVDGLGDGV